MLSYVECHLLDSPIPPQHQIHPNFLSLLVLLNMKWTQASHTG